MVMILRLFLVFISLLFFSCTTVPLKNQLSESPQKFILKWTPGVPPARLGGFTTINGYKIFVWIDTGAFESYYYHTKNSEHFLKTLGKPLKDSPEEVNFNYFPNNPQHVHQFEFSFLRLGNWNLRPFFVYDVSGYFDFGSGNQPTEGLVLGTQAFQNSWLVWQASTKTLTIYPQGSAPQLGKGWTSVPAFISKKEGRLYLKAEQKGRPYWLFVDTGATNLFPFVNQARNKSFLEEDHHSRFENSFGEFNIGDNFTWAGLNFQNPLVVINQAMPLGNARIGFPWVSKFDWAVYYSDNVKFLVKLPPHFTHMVDTSFPFVLDCEKTPKGFKLILMSYLGDSEGNFSQNLPPLGTEIIQVDGKVFTAQDWPFVEAALQSKKQISLSWIDHDKVKTAIFFRSIGVLVDK